MSNPAFDLVIAFSLLDLVLEFLTGHAVASHEALALIEVVEGGDGGEHDQTGKDGLEDQGQGKIDDACRPEVERGHNAGALGPERPAASPADKRDLGDPLDEIKQPIEDEEPLE